MLLHVQRYRILFMYLLLIKTHLLSCSSAKLYKSKSCCKKNSNFGTEESESPQPQTKLRWEANTDGMPVKSTTRISKSEIKDCCEKKMFTINELLFELGIDNVNLFKLGRYLEESNLPRKVLGFVTCEKIKEFNNKIVVGASRAKKSTAQRDPERNESTSEVTPDDQHSSPLQVLPSGHVSALSSVQHFLMSLMNDDKDGRVVALQMHSLSNKHSMTGVLHEKNNTQNSRFNGKIGLEDEKQSMGSWYLKFIMLNPAIHFQELVQSAQAVVLLGGTMQPFDYIEQQLIANIPRTRECSRRTMYSASKITRGIKEKNNPSFLDSSCNLASRFGTFRASGPRQQQDSLLGSGQVPVRTFSCGHVIPPTSVLPLALGKGPTGVELDFTFQSRASPTMLDELARVVYNICTVTPQVKMFDPLCLLDNSSKSFLTFASTFCFCFFCLFHCNNLFVYIIVMLSSSSSSI